MIVDGISVEYQITDDEDATAQYVHITSNIDDKGLHVVVEANGFERHEQLRSLFEFLSEDTPDSAPGHTPLDAENAPRRPFNPQPPREAKKGFRPQ